MVARKNKVTKTARSDDSDYSEHQDSTDDDSRNVYLVGDIDQELIKSVTERLINLAEKDAKKPINLIINTHGGEVDDTFMLYDMMKYVPTPVHTVGLGKVMSAGCLLLAAGEKGHRKMGRNARLMYHLGWEAAAGTIFELKSFVEAFDKQEKQYDAAFAKETGMTLKAVEKLYNKNGPTADTYLTAEEAFNLGIIDEIIE